MPRDDFPDLTARAAKLCEVLLPLLRAQLGEGFGVTVLVMDLGKKGGSAYASTVARDSMISALEELVLNMHAERARGPREPTVAETLAMLTRAAIRVLEVSEEHVSEEEGLRRCSELAKLVGYPPKKAGPAA